ncbi:hypothetical protein SCA6_006583 [Theobroma cacao]
MGSFSQLASKMFFPFNRATFGCLEHAVGKGDNCSWWQCRKLQGSESDRVILPMNLRYGWLVITGSVSMGKPYKCRRALDVLFFKQEMELSLIGLQNAGKTSLVNVIATGGYSEDMIPTVGFNMRKVTKGNVTIKLWDLGGQPRFRSMWERYCRAVSAIVYVVDAADYDNLPVSRRELHDLLSKSSLNSIPLLVLGNKIDKRGALSKENLTEQMGLRSITDREVCCFMISCKNSTNIDTVIDWLVKHSKSKN